MPAARKKKRLPTRPFEFHCSQCPSVEIVYAEGDGDAAIKIAGRGWQRSPHRCLRCVAAADQKRTGVLEIRI